jgi:hypothetical protein
MATSLSRSPVSMTINSGHIVQEERTLEILCPDRNLNNAVVTNEAGEQEFALSTKPFLTSWSVRRSLKDKSKLSQWEVQDPQEKQLCLIKDGELPGKITNATAQLHTGDAYASISMKSSDHAGTTTVFEFEGVPIAEMSLTTNNDVSFLQARGLSRTAWKLRVAAGADLALILALAFCRVEINHLWRR